MLKPKRRTRSVGRPGSLNREVADKICAAIRKGATRKAAASHAGIQPATFYRWMSKGAEGVEGKYVAFRDEVLEAEQSLSLALSTRAYELAMEGSPMMIKFLLQTRCGKDWVKTDAVQHEHRVAGNAVNKVVHMFSAKDLLDMSPEGLQRVMAARYGEPPEGPGPH